MLRIWRREGLKVPRKQRPRSRLWLNDGSCIRLRPERRNHVWSYDFVEAQMVAGEGQVITGWKNKMQVAMAHVLPPEQLAKQHSKETAPGSADKD